MNCHLFERLTLFETNYYRVGEKLNDGVHKIGFRFVNMKYFFTNESVFESPSPRVSNDVTSISETFSVYFFPSQGGGECTPDVLSSAIRGTFWPKCTPDRRAKPSEDRIIKICIFEGEALKPLKRIVYGTEGVHFPVKQIIRGTFFSKLSGVHFSLNYQGYIFL